MAGRAINWELIEEQPDAGKDTEAEPSPAVLIAGYRWLEFVRGWCHDLESRGPTLLQASRRSIRVKGASASDGRRWTAMNHARSWSAASIRNIGQPRDSPRPHSFHGRIVSARRASSASRVEPESREATYSARLKGSWISGSGSSTCSQSSRAAIEGSSTSAPASRSSSEEP